MNLIPSPKCTYCKEKGNVMRLNSIKIANYLNITNKKNKASESNTEDNH
jgi:hypothetical protein